MTTLLWTIYLAIILIMCLMTIICLFDEHKQKYGYSNTMLLGIIACIMWAIYINYFIL